MSASKRARVIETNYGRACDWNVEFAGQTIARLVDPRNEDANVYTYRVEMLTQDPGLRDLFYHGALWYSVLIVYRNVEFGEVAPYSYPSGESMSRLAETGRLTMRRMRLRPPPEPCDDQPSRPRHWWSRLRQRWSLTKASSTS